MNFGKFMEKRIRITFLDGDAYEGVAKDFSSGLDNPDGVATICVGNYYEFSESEIAGIEIIPAEMPIAPYRAVMQEAV